MQKRDEKFVDYISDSSIMCVSHIASYFEEGNNEDYNRFRRPVFLYNAYDEYKQDKLDYEEGYKTLGDFEKDLKLKLKGKLEKKENYTHIILFCMGWNNNQQESIYRYNKIVTNLKNIAPEKDFKPLVIGLCWPSSWLTIENSLLKKYLFFFASYFTKQDDADEVGMTIANLIIHNIVLKVKAEIKDEINKEGKNVKLPKIIAIGHSMGARILSRAIFSDGYLVPKYEGDIEVDLFIGLQGAFSANRFVAFDGWEGSPYAELCNRETVFSLTTSGNDKANPIAAKITGAKHTGGRHGLRIAKKRKNSNIFEEVVTWSKTNMQSNLDELDSIKDDREQRNEKKVIMIDVTSILEKDKNRYPDPKDAHNDILDAGMAELIWALIQNFANYSNKK
ncbi:MAG: alpha/beta hydrolase [Candidatus Brocadiales bacterium]|nr:alpha/beta hydrolase [Candidatus Brocadiales bacterium]